jgi:hypothetical protein
MCPISGGTRPVRPPQRPQRAEEFPPVDIRVWPSHCLLCRKKFEREDRLIQVFNCTGVGFDSEMGRELAAAGPFFEIAHLNCADPKALGTVISVGGNATRIL